MSIYNNDELAIALLSKIGVTRKRIESIINRCPKVFDFLCGDKNFQKELLGDKNFQKLIDLDPQKEISEIENFLNEKDIKLTTLISENFPNKLNEIEYRPVVMFFCGDLSIINGKVVGIVGTRKPTSYGRFITGKFVGELVESGVVTASGLAYGIDSEVARQTLSNNGKTIAVLGGGLCQIYPSSNVGLAKSIVDKGGLVISEYFPTARPSQYTFPERNRIISGVSDGVLVVEAGLNSGSLITANCTMDQGKSLFVVPGNIDSLAIEGSNKLIEEYPDTFTLSTDKIFKELGINKSSSVSMESTLSPTEKLVISALSTGIKSTDEFCEILKEDYKTTNLLLTEMEIGGIIKKLPGDYYCRKI